MKRLSAIALAVPSDSRTITNRPPSGKVGTASRSGSVRSKWRPVNAADAGEMGRVWRDFCRPQRLLCRDHWVEAAVKPGKQHAMRRDWQPRKLLVEAVMFPETDEIS